MTFLNQLSTHLAATGWSAEAQGRLEAALAAEPSPQEGRDRRRLAASCMAVAAVLGFAVAGALEAPALARTAPRWPSAVSDSSPSVLLLADRR